jgi:hypothetical protein
MKRTLTLLLACFVGIGLLAVPTAAASDGFLTDTVDGEEIGMLEKAQAVVDGFVANVMATASNAAESVGLSSDDTSVTNSTSNIRDELTGHETLYLDYINNRTSASDAHDVWRVEMYDDGEKDTFYVTANATSSGYENVSVVDSTSRTVDEWVCGDEYATENLASDLKNLRTEYVEDGEDIPRTEAISLGTEYAGHLHSSSLGHSESDCPSTE